MSNGRTTAGLKALLGASVFICSCPQCTREDLTIIKVRLPAVARCSGVCGRQKSGTFVVCRPCDLAICVDCITSDDRPANKN